MLRLTHIELLGFKSFPHKTLIELEPGVTCIVGPNGSGKSNIADAVQFAFGSQSGHELRARRLAGLIFAGTDQLRPLNFASVTLHLERTAHDLVTVDDPFHALPSLDSEELDLPEIAAVSQPVGSHLAERSGFPGADLTRHVHPHSAAEIDRIPVIVKQLAQLKAGERVSLTRRVFRDGTGGYYLNGEPVRLKDVDQLFSQFNLGRSAVFAISQGEVEKKILDTPQELREWLAEATGVALLLQQKQRAQHKLKRSRQNLERLEDILRAERELVEDLASQRKCAEEYLRLKAQLNAVELNEIRREVEYAQRQQEHALRALAELAEQLDTARQALAAKQAEMRRREHERTETEERLAQTEDELATQREAVARLRQEAAVARHAGAAAVQAIGRTSEDARDVREQVAAHDRELAANAEALADARAELAAAVAGEQQTQRVLEKAKAVLDAVGTEQVETANAAFELAQVSTRLRNELEGLKRDGSQLTNQLDAREQQLIEARQRVAELEWELASEEQKAGGLEADAEEGQGQLDEQVGGLQELAGQIRQLEARGVSLRDTLAELTARRDTLRELGDARVGHEGVALVLDNPDLASSVRQVTEVGFPPEYRPAFTRLLSHLGEALVGDPSRCATLLDLLGESSADVLLLHGTALPELHQASLWHHLEAPVQVRSALCGMLGDVVVVDDVAAAEQVLAASPGLAAVVLRSGEALFGRTFSYIGKPSPERALKVARRSDLREMDGKIAEAKRELEETEQSLQRRRSEHTQRQWERDETAAALAACRERQRGAREMCERLSSTLEERQAELELYEKQTAQLGSDQARLAGAIPQLEEQLRSSMAEQAENERRAALLVEKRKEAETRVDEARTTFASSTTRRELAEQHERHQVESGLDLAERASNLRTRLAELEQRLAELDVERVSSERAAHEADENAALSQAGLEDTGTQLTSLRQRRRELSSAAAEDQELLSQLSNEVSRLEQDEVAMNAQRERATERVGEWLDELEQRFGMTLSQLMTDPAISASPPGSELDVGGAGRGKLREERTRLAALLAELGAVNLLAIEQHQEHAARLVFLEGQADDLGRAMADLEQLISDLDRTTERQYRSSLRRIEARFNEIYLHLFGSGWARLRFLEPDDIINSGVEVEVQLPAGRRHSMRSLSGGQRSLIFLALFFAVHSVRSPGFCVLDEADATLDDANVERFTRLIQGYAAEEQFIVISHNKRTMETADKLIGVVGRPKGVSNLLEVNLKEARRLAHKGVA